MAQKLNEGDEVIVIHTREWSYWHRCVVTAVNLLGEVEIVPVDNSQNRKPMIYGQRDAERFLRKVAKDG